LLRDDQARVAWYTREAAAAQGGRREALEDALELAKAQVELDKDDVDDAREDLIRAGGDPQDLIQRMVQEHDASSRATPGSPPAAAPGANGPFGERGLVHQGREWLALRRQRLLLLRAKQDAETTASRLSRRHQALEAQIDMRVAAAPEPGGQAGGESSLVLKTRRLSSERKTLTALDKRIGDQEEIAGIYSRWSAVVADRQRVTFHRGLFGVLLILLVTLVGLLSDSLVERWIGKVTLERRRVEQLRTLTRVTLRVVGVLLILLVVVGPPGQLATVLGLAGAGLTVALKDFIVGFIGWFVLMGKNGVRLGDWVEINGVSGEVVELGPFHTVLLETGNWAASGHPTGRRVTFPNSFAIEGHYFNFSTSGQWLWDELQVHLPSGQDPYPIVEAISIIVSKETQANARLAEQEWRRLAQSKELKGFSAEPAVSVRPVSGGVEVLVRYMTRANERHQLRSRLYQSVVELLGRGKIQPAPAPVMPQPAARDSH
jgi:small-conductance mechanosensitive channel